jgi:hypothetical protein
MKVLKSRFDMRKYEWRVWVPGGTSGGTSGGGRKGKNSVSAIAWNTRVAWLSFLDDWCERHLLERVLSRFHVKKPAVFLDDVMGLVDDLSDDDAPQPNPLDNDLKSRNIHRKTIISTNLESYLDKRSPGFFALWQRRYFVYMEAEDMIVYYKSREEYLHGSEPVGSFQIADLSSAEAIGGLEGRELHLQTLTAPGISPEYSKKDRPVSPPADLSPTNMGSGPPKLLGRGASILPVTTVKQRTYKLRALTTESRDQWVAQLKARINLKTKLAKRKVQEQVRAAHAKTAQSLQEAVHARRASALPAGMTGRLTPSASEADLFQLASTGASSPSAMTFDDAGLLSLNHAASSPQPAAAQVDEIKLDMR